MLASPAYPSDDVDEVEAELVRRLEPVSEPSFSAVDGPSLGSLLRQQSRQ